jgi:hypothetical protein
VLTTGSALVFDGTTLANTGKFSKTRVSAGTTGTPVSEQAFVYTDGSALSGVYGVNAHQSTNATWLNFVVTNAAGAASTAATLDFNGNLGLGVTPSAWVGNTALQVGSVGAVSSSTTGGTTLSYNAYSTSAGWAGKYINNGYASIYEQVGGAHYWLTAPSGTAGNVISFTQAMTLDASGRLVVGNTSTVSKFEVNSGTNLGGLLIGFNGGSSNFYDADTQYFRTGNGTERARIDSSGNLLVGTTSQYSSGKVNVLGTAFTNGIVYRDAANNYTFLGQNSAGTNTFLVNYNGNVTNTNNSYGAISDIKFKENIVDTTPKLDKLNQVRIVNFNLIGEEQKQLGVIAQELEQIFPSMVDEAPDKDEEGNDLGTTTKSVKYSVFVPMLIKALQELDAKFEAYKATHP